MATPEPLEPNLFALGATPPGLPASWRHLPPVTPPVPVAPPVDARARS